MKEIDIIEGNKLIAKFMGGIYNSNLFPIGDTEIWLPYHNICYKNKLKYHSDWNWIMAVIIKIESLRPDIGFMVRDWFEVNRFNKTCIIKSGLKHADGITKSKFYYEKSISAETEILAVWESIVEFIKWYNKQLN